MEQFRNWIHDGMAVALAPLAGLCQRAEITPNQLSITGVLLNVVAAALIVSGDLAVAGLVYLLGGLFDALDGIVARLGDTASRFGAFLDSTLDRVSEGVVFAALAYAFADAGRPADAALVVMALLGSLLVSYTRARAEGLGAQCRGGMVTRAERVVLVGFGLIAGLSAPVIYFLVAATAVTVAQRIAIAYRQLASKEPGAGGLSGKYGAE